jgi:hypothetical protein
MCKRNTTGEGEVVEGGLEVTEMKILHILRSEPDEVVKNLIKASSEGNEAQQFELYKEDADYDTLIELVFEHDKVICWW